MKALLASALTLTVLFGSAPAVTATATPDGMRDSFCLLLQAVGIACPTRTTA